MENDKRNAYRDKVGERRGQERMQRIGKMYVEEKSGSKKSISGDRATCWIFCR